MRQLVTDPIEYGIEIKNVLGRCQFVVARQNDANTVALYAFWVLAGLHHKQPSKYMERHHKSNNQPGAD